MSDPIKPFVPDSNIPALKISGFSKSYGAFKAVDNLDLVIPEGEIFGLLGPNGAGKSTTIHSVTGVTKFQEGSIEVFGRCVQKQSSWTRRYIGMMHQEIYPDNFFALGTALKIHVGYYGFKDDPEWRDRLIDKLGLRPHLEKKMLQLSGGLKRRFALAKALIHKPKLLILDEPTAGVDVELRISIWNFVREINAQGTTVVLTTHYLEEAEKMCGRVGIMNAGKLVALDTSRNLADRFQDRELQIVLQQSSTDSANELPAGLKSLEARRSGENLINFPLKRDQSVGPILEALRSNQFEIKDFSIKSSSLEDVFLKLTSSSTEGPKP
jgi:ABC-2 type transport system ATP-binding protein